MAYVPPPMSPSTMAAYADTALYEVVILRLDEAAQTAGSLADAACRQYGPDHVVTRAAVAFRDAVVARDLGETEAAYLPLRAAIAELPELSSRRA